MDGPDSDWSDAVECEESHLGWFAGGAVALGYITEDQAAVITGPDVREAIAMVRMAIWRFAEGDTVNDPRCRTDGPGNSVPDWSLWPDGKPVEWEARILWGE
jgi:hypothetical protein